MSISIVSLQQENIFTQQIDNRLKIRGNGRLPHLLYPENPAIVAGFRKGLPMKQLQKTPDVLY